MITEKFIDFVKEIVPSVSMETAEEVKKWIRDTERIGYESYYSREQKDLLQGDVIDGIKFILVNEEGKLMVTPKMKAMVMSTSCDIEQDDNITLCPLFENSDLKESVVDAVKNNLKYDALFINAKEIENYHIRFSVSNTVSKKYIFNALKEGRIKKIFTMSRITHYLFIVKLTLHYMRHEDAETTELRLCEQ